VQIIETVSRGRTRTGTSNSCVRRGRLNTGSDRDGRSVAASESAATAHRRANRAEKHGMPTVII